MFILNPRYNRLILLNFRVTDCSKIKNKSIVPITADEEYAKNPEITKQNIEDLRKWLATQPHLPQNIPGNNNNLIT